MERDYDKIKLILQTLTACVLLTIVACYFRAPFEGFMAAYTLAVTVAFYLYTAGVLTQIQQESALKTSAFSKYNDYRMDTLFDFQRRLYDLDKKYIIGYLLGYEFLTFHCDNEYSNLKGNERKIKYVKDWTSETVTMQPQYTTLFNDMQLHWEFLSGDTPQMASELFDDILAKLSQMATYHYRSDYCYQRIIQLHELSKKSCITDDQVKDYDNQVHEVNELVKQYQEHRLNFFFLRTKLLMRVYSELKQDPVPIFQKVFDTSKQGKRFDI